MAFLGGPGSLSPLAGNMRTQLASVGPTDTSSKYVVTVCAFEYGGSPFFGVRWDGSVGMVGMVVKPISLGWLSSHLVSVF
jgi:hypothetical protein